MAAEQFANAAQSTLAAALTSGATSFSPTSVALFPASPQFRILVDAELMLVTAVTGGLFTVSRGIEGTAAAQHAQGALVTAIVTAGGIANAVAHGGAYQVAGAQALPLVNGGNNNVAVTAGKVLITGPSGSYAISGIAAPADAAGSVIDGADVLLINTTSQQLTLNNLNGGSSAANQIDTLTGADVVLPARKSFARLTYDATSSHWLLTDHS
jgi:hypothetical protein